MDAVEEVKNRLSIEDVISEYVQLKRAGRNWKGLSPFTNEKTPSFTVSPEKQIWHDFSSGKGGDMFTFVQEMEGLDFRGSLELLARRAGVDLDQFQSRRQGGPNKEKLYEISELAAKFYQTQFSKSTLALEYVFKKREFTKETALAWRLGYAPNTGKALVEFLKKQGYKEADIKLAGLTNRYGGDMFRERLMIPLADPQGRIVGFTARQLAENDNGPKYINTPSTPLYDKSRHVYGLHLAKETIRKQKYVVLAEGNLDVIMSHQAGVKNVVATAGTALTEPHLKALGRFTGDIRLCFDADRAGMEATERAIPIASKTKVNLSVISIPSGKDPDELIKQDVQAWQEIIQKPQYALDWLMERYQNVLDISTAEGKRRYSDVLLPVVKSLSDVVEQDHYLNVISKATGTSVEALKTKMEHGSKLEQNKPLRRPKTEVKKVEQSSAERTKLEDHFLSLMLLHKDLRTYMRLLRADMFSREESGEMFAFLETHPDYAGAQDKEATDLRPLKEYSKILGLQYEELYQGLEYTELHYEAARLQARLVETFVKTKKQQLATELTNADDATTQKLLAEARELDVLLKQTTGGA
ncbi:DNA primase [Candidatus Saccharibacteria bacterium]|nr:DNA primase [Candidatus Saccharibacteria bacterium]